MQMTMRKRGKESVSSVRKIGGRRRRREREKEKEVEVAVVERKRENSLARALALFFVPSLAIIIPRQCGMTFPRGVEVKTEECLEKRNLSREYFPLSHSLSRALGVLRSNFLEGKKKKVWPSSSSPFLTKKFRSERDERHHARFCSALGALLFLSRTYGRCSCPLLSPIRGRDRKTPDAERPDG